MRLLLGASLISLVMLAGCASETGPGTLGCSEGDCTKSPRREGESTSTRADGTPATDADPYSNVARPVTPATPSSPSSPTTTTPGTPAAAPTPAAPAPAPVFATAPIARRYLDGDHLFTRDPNEAPGWLFEGLPFRVFDAPHPDTKAIYRCLVGTQHFVSNDEGCEGQVSEGALGWLSTVAAADRFELIRCRNATGSDHLVSTADECNAAGYIIEGALGFAIRAQ